HPERHHKARLANKGRQWSKKGIPRLPRPLHERSRPTAGRSRHCPRAHDSAGGCQYVVHQMRRRFDCLERPQPLPPSLYVREQRTTNGADAPMGFEALHAASRTQLAFALQSVIVQSVIEERFELGALHPVFGLVWHQITCLYVRCSRRASSARPRLILDLTVPSGTLKAVAISRQSMSCRSLKITASRSSGD